MSAVETSPAELGRRSVADEISRHAPTARDARPRSRSLRARLITVVVLATAGLTLLLAVPALRQVLVEIRRASAAWLVLAVALELASCLSFIVIFRRFFARVPVRLARELAWTEMGSGALLPGGGIGSLAAGGWLLHQSGMPTRQILRRSSGLFFLTSAVNVAALIAGGLLAVTGASGQPHLLLGGAPVLAGLVVAGAVAALPPLRGRARRSRTHHWSAEVIAGIREAERVLRRPTWRLAGAIGYLGFDIAVLWTTLHAVGYSPPLATLLLGYLIGYLANLIPVPGGIGVLEGGLAGTLILYGAPASQAAAAALIYHAIAFWIPSLGGLLGYRQITRQLPHAREAPPPASASGTAPCPEDRPRSGRRGPDKRCGQNRRPGARHQQRADRRQRLHRTGSRAERAEVDAHVALTRTFPG
jgi:uncharacterized membrane protein YbhN (UPF0104 family)